MSGSPARRWSGGAIRTWGWSPSVALSASICAGGRPIMVRSYSLRSSPRMISSRLPTDKRHPDAGIFALEGGDDIRRKIFAGADHAENQRAGRARLQRVDPLGSCARASRSTSFAIASSSRRFRSARRARSACALEQGRADPVLQEFELDADGRRRHVERLGGAAHRAAIHGGGEGRAIASRSVREVVFDLAQTI